VIGVRPWAAATAAATATPGYLTRSGYAGLEGTSFTVEAEGGPVALRLESVKDVAGARVSRALAGSEDSFALTFSGPSADPLDSGIHTLSHPQLGSFELFASPVDDPDAGRRYEIVVDRSLPETVARRAAPEGTAPAAEKPAPDEPATESPASAGAIRLAQATPAEPSAAARRSSARARRLRRAARRRARVRRRRHLRSLNRLR
jgi:hypothetical protein